MNRIERRGIAGNRSMVHGYHVIIVAYGFWLPNDPRGSWSEMVARWELFRFGPTTKSLARRELAQLTPADLQRREVARASLKYPAVRFSGVQARSIARGLGNAAAKNGYAIWACSILPEHMHLVVGRHRYKIEQIANLLKGATTAAIRHDGLHPLQRCTPVGERPPSMWARHQWSSFLDSEQAIDDAIGYVRENPIKEGKPAQHWNLVTPFGGLSKGWVTYH